MTTRRTILRSREPASHWNFIAGEPLITLRFNAKTHVAIALDANGVVLFRSKDPFVALDWMAAFNLSAMPDVRWVGWIGYDFAREIERLPTNTHDDLGLAESFEFTLSRRVGPAPPSPHDAIAQESVGHAPPHATFANRSMTRDAYLRAVVRALDYIAAGDVFQVNLAQRFTFDTGASAWEIWKALNSRSPAAFGALIEHDNHALISNSPELFFRIEPQSDGSRKIVNRPIKGTRPNSQGMFDQLSHSVKDRAELAMIVDLQRNDLGRVCEIGSVVVTEPRVIEETSTVYHGVATIEGSLRRDAGFADVIRALFPCGSITGCPKVRAMEIIDELEPVARGPYCGAIGYLAADGTIEFNVAIRTMILKDGVAHVYVGGGIVADSSSEAEYDETLVKAAAMLKALGVDAALVL